MDGLHKPGETNDAIEALDEVRDRFENFAKLNIFRFEPQERLKAHKIEPKDQIRFTSNT